MANSDDGLMFSRASTVRSCTAEKGLGPTMQCGTSSGSTALPTGLSNHSTGSSTLCTNPSLLPNAKLHKLRTSTYNEEHPKHPRKTVIHEQAITNDTIVVIPTIQSINKYTWGTESTIAYTTGVGLKETTRVDTASYKFCQRHDQRVLETWRHTHTTITFLFTR